MSGHTPGKWRVAGKLTIRCGDGWIAKAFWRNGEANACLMASAPELYEALQDAVDQLAYYVRASDEIGGKILDRARAALAAADGGA